MDQTSLIQAIFQTGQGSINISLIILLLAIGYVIKHFTKINNDNIPVIMLIAGIVLALIINIPYSPSEIVTIIIQGIVSGAAAIGLHTNGKGLLEIFKAATLPSEDDMANSGTPPDNKEESDKE